MANDVSWELEIHAQGVIETLKSEGMRAELEMLTQELALDANLEFDDHFPKAEVDGYAAAVDEGDYEFLGVIYTKTKLGMLDEAKYHTLESLNH